MATQLALGRALRESDQAEAQRLLEEVFNETSPQNHPAFHTRAATSLASLHHFLGERDEQRRCAEVAVKAAQAAGSRRGQAIAWATLGASHLHQCEYDEARRCHERSLSLSRPTGYLYAAKLALSSLAAMAGRQGDAERALALYQEALAVDEQARDHISHSASLYCLSWAYGLLGRTDAEAEYLYRAIESSETYGPESVRLMALNSLAVIYSHRGDISRSKRLLEDVIGSADSHGLNYIMLPALINMGQHSLDAGDTFSARKHLERALACYTSPDPEASRPLLCAEMARLCMAERKPGEASDWLGRAEHEARAGGWKQELGRVLAVQAAWHDTQGNVSEAERCYKEADKHYSDVGDTTELAELRLEWGRWLAQTGRCEAAVPILERASASARRMSATAVAEQANRLLFDLRRETDREAALLDGLAGLAALGLEPTTRLERMCEMTARGLECRSATVLLGNESVVVYGRPDLKRAKRVARKRRPAATDTDLLFVLAAKKRFIGTAWFERQTPSGARLNPATAQRVSQLLAEPLALIQQARAQSGIRPSRAVPGLNFRGAAGSNKAMLESLKLVRKLAQSVMPVLVQGESGTGKELVARALHESGPRWNKPFVAVNCAAVPAGLLEAEFFGVEKGAATGVSERPGKFELAHKGTIFLDEIADMSLELQARLLRVLQEQAFERVGGTRTIVVDARVVAATNQDLERLVREGRFREDLYFRLNGCEIVLPPLKERKEDIPVLARHFISQGSQSFGRDLPAVDPTFLRRLRQYDWPGNIRELHNVIERCVLVSPGPVLTADDLPRHIQQARQSRARHAAQPTPTNGRADVMTAANQAQRRLLLDCLKKTDWNVRAAARLSGYGHSQFYRLLKKHRIHGSRRHSSKP